MTTTSEIETPTTIIRPSRGWGALGLRDVWEYRELLCFLLSREVKGRFRHMAVAVSVIAFLMGVVLSAPVTAQQPPLDWSPPQVIVDTQGVLAVSGMDLVADRSGQLHLIYPHQPDDSSPFGIDHALWDGTVWSQPVNVIVNADGSRAQNVRATIDGEQIIHLIWGGGLNNLWYARAPAAVAGSPHGWTEPQVIATALTEAGIAGAPDATLHVGYASPSGEVSSIHSDDGGATWSNPRVVAPAAPGTATGEVDVAVDGAGLLHVTWTEFTLPDGVPSTGVFYSRSLDGGLTWEEPLQLDDERHGEIGVGTAGDDRIHLVWRSNIGGDGTFHQWSGDGGRTWSPPDREDDRGGMSGMPSFAVDSAGGLHYTIGPAKVAAWRDGRLSSYMDVAEEPRLRAQQGLEGSPPERAVLAITGGNQLHVLFETGFDKLWHTTRIVDSPAVQPVALPTVEASPEPPSPSRGTAAPAEGAATVGPPAFEPGGQPPESPRAVSAVTAGTGASLALVLAVVVWRVRRRRR